MPFRPLTSANLSHSVRSIRDQFNAQSSTIAYCALPIFAAAASSSSVRPLSFVTLFYFATLVISITAVAFFNLRLSVLRGSPPLRCKLCSASRVPGHSSTQIGWPSTRSTSLLHVPFTVSPLYTGTWSRLPFRHPSLSIRYVVFNHSHHPHRPAASFYPLHSHRIHCNIGLCLAYTCSRCCLQPSTT